MIFLVVFLLPHSALAFDNEPTGFRGIEWWTHISKLSGMRLLDDKDVASLYVRDGDKHEIGAAKVVDIWYSFYLNRFSKVTITFKSYSNYIALRKTLFEAFGAGYGLGTRGLRYNWSGFRVVMDLDYDKETEMGELEIRAKGVFYYEPEKDGSRKVESAAPGL
jgi:hypothetical protein